MKRLAKYFFEGLMILVPVLVSIYIIFAIFEKVDGLLNLPIPGAGFIVTLLVITFIGFLGSNFFTKRIVKYFEKLFANLPIVKIFYSSIRDLVGAFVGDKKSFDRPVLVNVDEASGAKSLGFITREDLEFLSLKDHVAVYFPQSYNFAGELVLFPRDRVTAIETSSTEVMRFLVSGGVSGGGK